MKLKPCPFCGKSVMVWESDADDEQHGIKPQWFVVCDFTKGGCGAEGGFAETKQLAKKAWNRREKAE